MMRADENPLAAYLWKNRVLVVVADNDHRSVASRQRQVLADSREELQERGMMVISVVGELVEVDGVVTDGVDAGDLRRSVGASEAEFGVLLIGKDGGVKLRSDALVDAERLFALIDTMPIRRQEMRIRSHPTR